MPPPPVVPPPEVDPLSAAAMACICVVVRELSELIWDTELMPVCISAAVAPDLDEVASGP